MFSIGYWAGAGNNQITGCTFAGADIPAGVNNYANYHGGTSGYSEWFTIGTGYETHPDNILIENKTFKDGQGDHLITYSSCGTAQTGAANCNSGAPGTEGPSHITIYNNTFQHCAQPGLHINGGQNIHIANNSFTDCDNHGEEDADVLQVVTGIMWNDNTFITDSFGWYSPNAGSNYAEMRQYRRRNGDFDAFGIAERKHVSYHRMRTEIIEGLHVRCHPHGATLQLSRTRRKLYLKEQ